MFVITVFTTQYVGMRAVPISRVLVSRHIGVQYVFKIVIRDIRPKIDV